MDQFKTLFCFGLKRRAKDFFVLFYNIAFPIIIILLLGYLTSMSYGNGFTSYNYYTIVMIPFCVLFGITTVSYAAQDEKLLRTSYRYIVAPITKKQIVLSKFFSSIIVISICNILALLITKLLFNIDFNGKILMIIVLLTCETVAVTGIGLFISLGCKNLDTLRNFVNIPIIIFAFLGGAFFPVSSFNPVLSTIINLSPLTWINRSIVSCIYDNQMLMISCISIALLMVGFILTGLTCILFEKEAFI